MAIVRERTTENGKKSANGAKVDHLLVRSKSFFRSSKGRTVACVCGAAIVLLAIVLLALSVGGDTRLKGWPTGELMEGVQPPQRGRIASVREAEDAITVYFAEFPASELAVYMKTLGASPAGDYTYVAQKGEDRILAVVYDPATKQLSLTVTSAM